MPDQIGILVIADAPDLRRSLKHTLVARGFLVCEACGGADGLEAIEAGFAPHIVVADMDLPDLLEFRASMSARGDSDAIRIIALNEREEAAGAAPGAERLRGMAAAAVRPFDYVLFENVVRSLARGYAGPQQ